MRNLQLPGRSPVHAMNGMAATSNPLASQTAIDALKAGGNALDAAIAACAVQCVVEPGSTGIGGDCFALYAPGGGSDVIAYNGAGRAPGAATLEKFRELGIAEIEKTSPHSVIVPGAIEAWCRLNADHGRMPMADILAPAIGFARNGYPVGSRVASDWARSEDHLKSNEALSRIFLPAPRPGEVHRQPELAATMEAIAGEGRSVFYEGHLAAEMVETLQALGGLHTREDFASAAGEYVTPISAEFRGHTVVECPPQGQGVIALLLLNMMEAPRRGTDPLSVERIHLELEACRRAYAARGTYVGDPAQVNVATDLLLSDEYAARLRDDIDPQRAKAPDAEIIGTPHRDTVTLSVVDKDRNVCTFINTLFHGWGSGITTPKSGIVLTNRGQGFVLNEGHPNCIAPHKRPLHTLIPGIVQKDGRTVMSFGVMGGEYQAMGHMQFLTRLMDFGMDIQEAMDAPRFMVDPYDGTVEVEDGVPDATVKALRAMGHDIARAESPVGGSQAISINWESGVLTGGSDPRKDGCAIGY